MAHIKDDRFLRSILSFPYLGKVPNLTWPKV